MLGLLPYPLRHLLAIIFMEGSPQSTYDHAESGHSKRPRLDGGADITEEELAALPWGPHAGSLHDGYQPTFNPEEDLEVIVGQVLTSPHENAASTDIITTELRESGMSCGEALPLGNCAPESVARSIESFSKNKPPWEKGGVWNSGVSWVRQQAAYGWEMAAHAVAGATSAPTSPVQVVIMETLSAAPVLRYLCPFLSSRDDSPVGCDPVEWRRVSDLVSLAAQGIYQEGCAEALREFFAARCSVNREEARSILLNTREVSSHWAWWNEADFAMFTWATKMSGGIIWKQSAVAYFYLSTDQIDRLHFLGKISARQVVKGGHGLDSMPQLVCRDISKNQGIVASSNPAFAVVYDSFGAHFSPVLVTSEEEGGGGGSPLRVERVHAAKQPPGAAGAAAQANGMQVSKKRMTPLEKLTEGGYVPKLALSSDTDCNAIRLSSTLNDGTCMSVSLESDKIPSKEDLVARLGAKLEDRWSAVSTLYSRGPTSSKTREETWVQDTQSRVRAHVLERRAFEMQAKRPSRLFFISAYNPEFNLGVVHEETCPGLARSIFEDQDPLLLGVFSASLDKVPTSVSKRGKSTKQAASHNNTRTEDGHQKSLHYLVKKLEFNGARVLVFFDGSALGSVPQVLKEQRFNRQIYASQGFDGSSSSSSSTPSSTALWKLFNEAVQGSVAAGSFDYTLQTFASIFSGATALVGDVFISLGCIGLELVVNIFRQLRNLHTLRRSGSAPKSLEVANELLYNLGLISSSLLVVPGRKLLPRSITSPSGTSGGSSGFGYGECQSLDLVGSGAALSSSSLTSGYEEYVRLGLPHVLCVYENVESDATHRIYAMKEYRDDGTKTTLVDKWTLLVQTRFNEGGGGGGSYDPRCKCKYSIQAHSLVGGTSSVPGCIKNRCFHRHLLLDSKLAGSLQEKPIPSSVGADRGSYHVILTAPPPSDGKNMCTYLHVFVHAHGAFGVPKDSILTLTSGHISCDHCYSGKRQAAGTKVGSCPHGQHVKSILELVQDGDETWIADALRFQIALDEKDDTGSNGTSFDVERGIWISDSLSSKNEELNFTKLGVRPVNVEMSVEEIMPGKCNLGGPADDPHVDTKKYLYCVEPIPDFFPPLKDECGCDYTNQENPLGFTAMETDPSGKRHPCGVAHFLTHTRPTVVHKRNCSLGHNECEILYTGRHDGLHRQTYETMLRHEVVLLYWKALKDMGVSAAPFGSLLQQINRLGGGHTEESSGAEEAVKQKFFIGPDTWRSCIMGFLGRQRRIMNKPCPTCPRKVLPNGTVTSLCPNLAVDAKRLRIHRRHLTGESPEQTSATTPSVNVKKGCISQRLFWPGDNMKIQRALARSLTAALLGTKLTKKDAAFNFGKVSADSASLLSGAPIPFRPAVQLLLEHGGNEPLCVRAGNYAPSDSEDESGDEEEVEGGASDSTGALAENGGSSGGADGGATDDGSRPEVGLPWRCPAEAAGLRVGDTITHVNGTEVKSVSEAKAAIDSMQSLPVLQLKGTRMDGINFSLLVQKGANGKLCLMITRAVQGKGVCVHGFTTPSDESMPLPPPPSVALLYEVAKQISNMNNKQCESTQYLPKQSRALLSDFLSSYVQNGGFTASVIWGLSSSGYFRKSVLRLIDAAHYDGLGNKRWLHPAVYSMLQGMLSRASDVHAEALKGPPRIPVSSQSPYDPSTGVAYHFTQSGERLYEWPKYYNLNSDSSCVSCKKPDWMRTVKGQSEGVLTMMCLRSGVILGNTFLTGHEGCKDASAALYSYNTLQGLECVMSDTPCMHATYLNTRCGRDFDGIQHIGDRYHIGTHLCFSIYNPAEFAKYDHVNTSMIEQWHAIMDALTMTVKGSTLAHAMFLLQTLQDDHYIYMCNKNKYPEAKRSW